MKPVQETIGTILTENYERDAIHIAMFPATADEMLWRGDYVALENKKDKVFKVLPTDSRCIGLVDPFVNSRINPGQKFWVFLLPNTVTSLRHDWTHPAFTTEARTNTNPTCEESESWLRSFLDSSDCPGYDEVMRAINDQDGSWNPDYLHFQNYDAHGEIPPEFWVHVENVLGYAPKNKPSYFSCSC